MAARTQRKDWHPEDIKAELRKRLGNLTDLSKSWGFHRAAVSTAIQRPRGRPAVALLIAEALKQPPHTLWPDHYSPEGDSKPRTVNGPEHSRRATPSHRQKGITA
jgi:Ner family transcriptional regulator